MRRTAARPAVDAGDNAKLAAALAQERLVTLELLGHSPPLPWQRAFGLFIERGGLDLLLRAVVDEAEQARRAFLAGVSDFVDDKVRTAAGPSILVRLRRGHDEQAAAERLCRAGLLVGLGADFHAPSPSVRLSFMSVRPDEGSEAARRFEEALAGWR